MGFENYAGRLFRDSSDQEVAGGQEKVEEVAGFGLDRPLDGGAFVGAFGGKEGCKIAGLAGSGDLLYDIAQVFFAVRADQRAEMTAG